MRFPGPRRTALVTLAVSLTAVLATGVLVWAASRGGPPDESSAPRPAAAVIAPRAAPDLTVVRAVSSLAVLRAWDRARARAWARASLHDLRSLYVPGSRAGTVDLARLTAWRDRGLRVRGMDMQVLGVTLLRRTADTLVLRVTDRVVGAVAVPLGASGAHGEPHGKPLPQDRESTRRLTLVRHGGRWRMAAVVDVPRGQRAPVEGSSPSSPAASTASTSGSANS